MKILFFSVLMLFAGKIWAQSLVHLHTNKQTYTAGESIWLSIYLIDSLSGKLLTQPHPLHLQTFAPNGTLQSEELIYTQKGRGTGFINLPRAAMGGVYRVRAFTETMLKKGRQSEKRLVVQQPKDSTVALLSANGIDTVRNPQPLKISILPNKYIFEKRENVVLLLRVTDLNGQPQQGTFSLSITDLRVAAGASTLLSQLPAPTAQEPKDSSEVIVYGGRIINQKTKAPLPNAELVVMSLDSGKRFTRTTQADSSGRFSLRDLVFEDTQSVRYQVNSRRQKSIIDAVVEWKYLESQRSLPPIVAENLPITPNQQEQLTLNIQKPDGLKEANLEEGIALKEIEIVGEKKDDIDLTGIIKLHSEANFKMDFDPEKPMNMNVYDMMRMLPGVVVSGGGGGISGAATVTIRGIGTFNSNEPLFVVDGMPMTDVSGVVNGNDVIRMEVLSGANAAMYGVRGASGVIVIYTRRFRKVDASKLPSQTKADELKGYQPEKLFYNPDYSQPTADKSPDYRLTLYWNPEIITDANGEAMVSFYASDISSNFQITAEGMTRQNYGTTTKLIRVK